VDPEGSEQVVKLDVSFTGATNSGEPKLEGEEVTEDVVAQPEAVDQPLVAAAAAAEAATVLTPAFSKNVKKAFNFDQGGSTPQVRNFSCPFEE
jgi:hypothetical protein